MTAGVQFPEVTRELAAFALSPLDQAPASVRVAVRRMVAGTVASMVGAARHPAVERALATVAAFGAPAQASLLGRSERLSLPWTALLGGIAAHTGRSAAVVPAALAAGEWRDASGAAVLEAVVVGVEISARVAAAVGPEHAGRGWDLTGTLGHLGAAAAAGRLLGLNVDEMTDAIGIAATQAAGLSATLGTEAERLHAGKAAADGLEAALLARRGFTGAHAAIEGRRGLASTMSSRFDPEQARGALGRRWALLRDAGEPHACGDGLPEDEAALKAQARSLVAPALGEGTRRLLDMLFAPEPAARIRLVVEAARPAAAA